MTIEQKYAVTRAKFKHQTQVWEIFLQHPSLFLAFVAFRAQELKRE